MRRMGFSKLWPDQEGRSKLLPDEFTTFRFPRRDKDWILLENVLVVYQPRHMNYVLGMATIIKKEPRAASRAMVSGEVPLITEEEAVKDGFENLGGMLQWLFKAGWTRIYSEVVNKLTIKWDYPARTREKVISLQEILKDKTK